MLELYDALRGVAGLGGEPGFAPARPGELARIALDCAEAAGSWALAAEVGLADWARPVPGRGRPGDLVRVEVAGRWPPSPWTGRRR